MNLISGQLQSNNFINSCECFITYEKHILFLNQEGNTLLYFHIFPYIAVNSITGFGTGIYFLIMTSSFGLCANKQNQMGKHSQTKLHHIKPYNRGFTMIELLVVVIVLLIFTMGVLSTYQYSNPITDKLIAETDGLKVSLRFAQMLAFNNDTATWGISFPTNINYRLCKNNADVSVPMIPVKGQAIDPTESDYDPGLPNYHQVRGNVQITAMPQIINFDKWGRPLDGSGNLMMQDTMITLSVVTPGQPPDTHTFGVSKNTGFIYDVSQNQ